MSFLTRRAFRQGLALFTVCASMLVFAVPVAAQGSLRIAAVVNDEIISVYDLSARVWMTVMTSGLKNTPETRQRLASPTLRALIDEKLKMQEAREYKVEVKEDEIQAALARIENNNKLPPGQIDSFLEARNIDKTSLIEQIEADIAWKQLVGRRLGRQVVISNEEIDERIAQMQAAKGLPERRLGEIYLPIDSAANEAEVAQLAQRLFENLKVSKNFSEVARSFSRSPSAAIGGDLGWVRQGQLPDELERAVQNLKPNTLSPPVRALGGYYLLVMTDQRINQGAQMDDDTKLTLQQLFLPLTGGTTPQVAEQTIERARNLAAPAKSCTDMETISKTSASNLSGSLGVVPIKNLPDSLRNAVQDLPVGEPSQPVRTQNGVIVLMVCAREGGDANETLRASIKEKIFTQRITALAEEYLRDLRRKAFVDVRL